MTHIPLLTFGTDIYQIIREFDAPRTAWLLERGDIHPTRTLLAFGSHGRGDSLLYYAVQHSWYDGIALLMRPEYGGDPSAPEPYRRDQTPLAVAQENLARARHHTSASEESVDACYVLLLLGNWPVCQPLDPHRTDLTVLMHAAMRNHPYVIRSLLRNTLVVDPHVCDSLGHNALWYAMRRVDHRMRARHVRSRDDPNNEVEEADASLVALAGALDPTPSDARQFPFAIIMIVNRRERPRE
jgi:hypothetical protein